MIARTIPISRSLNPESQKLQGEVHAILKRVDGLIRGSDLKSAHTEVQRALELDPKNIYAHAFRDRILDLSGSMKEESLKPKPSVSGPPSASPASLPAAKEKESSPNSGVPRSLVDFQTDRETALEYYLGEFRQAWRNGAPSADDELRLRDLRTLFFIGEAEQAEIRIVVQRTAYTMALGEIARVLGEEDIAEDILEGLRSLYRMKPVSARPIETEILKKNGSVSSPV